VGVLNAVVASAVPIDVAEVKGLALQHQLAAAWAGLADGVG
jgi:hypothetical protein